MIKIDPNKQKNIKFKIIVEGIDPQLLEYNLRLSNGNIDYGFKGKGDGREVSFTIPALNEVVKYEVLESLNKVKLEVNDGNNKYYLRPFEDELKIQKNLKVEAQLSEEEEIDDTDIPKINASISEDKDEYVENNKEDEEKKSKKKKKKTKFGQFLG
jgi:hypothetical protein